MTLASVDWARLNSKTVDSDSHNCPFCGRVLWESLTDAGKSRYCESCDVVFRVEPR